ncbi:hypothetical protein OR1_00350 [Geobacter sp. OR-1]|nr:hypothetical protein OR1_00350 [Geobacter sp. OR-1]
MTTCDLITTCSFINNKISTMPATAKLITSSYCTKNPAECARNRVADIIGLDMIPADLSPSDYEMADKLLAEA